MASSKQYVTDDAKDSGSQVSRERQSETERDKACAALQQSAHRLVSPRPRLPPQFLPNPKNEENKAKETTATQQIEKCVARRKKRRPTRERERDNSPLLTRLCLRAFRGPFAHGPRPPIFFPVLCLCRYKEEMQQWEKLEKAYTGAGSAAASAAALAEEVSP